MINKYIILFYFFLFQFPLLGNQQESIYNYNNVAQSYSDKGLYEDALQTYNKILFLKKNIFGEYHQELISTLYKISDIYLAINDIESSEENLRQALNIQYNNFLKQQTDYIQTYNKIKAIYTAINDTIKEMYIDSLLNILYKLENDSIVFNLDNISTDPEVIYFQSVDIDSSNFVSKYSNNDKAIDLINSSLVYFNTGLYTESIKLLDQALQINASLIDKTYLTNINFGD